MDRSLSKSTFESELKRNMFLPSSQPSPITVAAAHDIGEKRFDRTDSTLAEIVCADPIRENIRNLDYAHMKKKADRLEEQIAQARKDKSQLEAILTRCKSHIKNYIQSTKQHREQSCNESRRQTLFEKGKYFFQSMDDMFMEQSVKASLQSGGSHENNHASMCEQLDKCKSVMLEKQEMEKNVFKVQEDLMSSLKEMTYLNKDKTAEEKKILEEVKKLQELHFQDIDRLDLLTQQIAEERVRWDELTADEERILEDEAMERMENLEEHHRCQRERLQNTLAYGLNIMRQLQKDKNELREDVELERSNWLNDFNDGMYLFQRDFMSYSNSGKLEINDLLNKKHLIEQCTDDLQEVKRKEKEDEENKIEQIKKDWDREETNLQYDLMEKNNECQRLEDEMESMEKGFQEKYERATDERCFLTQKISQLYKETNDVNFKEGRMKATLKYLRGEKEHLDVELKITQQSLEENQEQLSKFNNDNEELIRLVERNRSDNNTAFQNEIHEMQENSEHDIQEKLDNFNMIMRDRQDRLFALSTDAERVDIEWTQSAAQCEERQRQKANWTRKVGLYKYIMEDGQEKEHEVMETIQRLQQTMEEVQGKHEATHKQVCTDIDSIQEELDSKVVDFENFQESKEQQYMEQLEAEEKNKELIKELEEQCTQKKIN